MVDPLSDPGNIDVTSDVDFEELAMTGSQISNGEIRSRAQTIHSLRFSVQFFGPVSQRNFLYNLGIDVRATVGKIAFAFKEGSLSIDLFQALARTKTPEEQKEILSAVEKLVSPEYMGERFLYLCVQHTSRQHMPAGFSSSQ